MSRPPKVLLLNPPFHRSVSRDCYCSNPTKSAMLMHPLDLQIQSGFFRPPDFQPAFMDAIFERLSLDETQRQIEAIAPDIILSLIGDVALDNDAAFLAQLKSNVPATRLFLSGDVAKFAPKRILDAVPDTEGILLNFCSPGLKDYIENNEPDTPDLYLREKSPQTSETKTQAKSIDYPLPWTGFAQTYAYQLPFFSNPRFYSLLASYGCPHQCLYCNTHSLGYKSRSNAAFLEELAYAADLGFKSLYIRDATFGVNREKTLALFRAWEETGLTFEWMCFARPDHLDDEIIAFAARLGCRLMMLGVESFDEVWLRDVAKPMALTTVKRTFRDLRKHGIRSAALMMMGMQQNDKTQSVNNLPHYEQHLKHFLRELDPDFVSLNVFSRRPGIEAQHSSFHTVESNRPKYETLAARVNRAFYFHPRTLLRQLSLISSPKQLMLGLKTALRLLQ